ncbi:uncharacterized protein LOC113232200 [Hyposmocoma kahamanoa]|uniref:uncharacterized protein LOC113232200 n=1 Tax=Hyposmocoma kahamanoa TaxID=1477025 RepID=UPI000E6D8905|nr:uncharacterized protein LOC113232200 [Hyposmocoma kahamanoa]
MICQHCLGCPRFDSEHKCVDYKGYSARAESGDCNEGGDRGYQWKCVICHNAICSTDNPSTKESLLVLINAIAEKFELVNKIQIPKLNNDLMHIKSLTEHIVKQNEDILLKVAELDKRTKIELETKTKIKNECRGDGSRSHHKPTYRKRSFTIASKPKESANKYNKKGEKELVTSVSLSEKNLRFSTRRRSYALHKMFLLINNRNRQRSSRQRCSNI